MAFAEIINAILLGLDAAIQLADKSGRLQQMASKAIAEGRGLSDEEIETLKKGAEDAIQKARDND